MRAAELFALANAHGIDVQQAAKQTNATKPRMKSRVSALIERLQRSQIPRDVQARGRQTHVVRRAEWSLAELGQAAEGVPLIPWLAACYVYARDRSCYWPLWNQLSIDALEMRLKFGWPARCTTVSADPKAKQPGESRFYLLELASLVLDEEANLPIFQAAPVLYAHYMGVDPETWDSGMSLRFDRLKRRFAGWVQTCESMVNARLTDEPEVVTVISTPRFSRDVRHSASSY